MLDSGNVLEGEEHFRSIHDSLTVRVPGASGMGDALKQLVAQGLQSQYPGHPDLGTEEVRLNAVQRVWQLVLAALDNPQQRCEVEKSDRERMRHVAEPLQLGKMGDTHFSVQNHRHWLTHFHKKMADAKMRSVSAAQLHRWMDEPEAMGLPAFLRNLVVLTFARQTDRSFTDYQRVVEGAVDSLKGTWELREQSLPDESVWARATERANQLLDRPVATVRNATNVDELIKLLVEWAGRQTEAGIIRNGLLALNKEAGVKTPCARCQTAASLQTLSQQLGAAAATDLVQTFVQETDGLNLGVLQKASSALGGLTPLMDEQTRNLVCVLLGYAESGKLQAEQQARELQHALQNDEFTVELAPVLRAATRLATRLAAEKPPTIEPIIEPFDTGGAGGAGVTTRKRRLVAERRAVSLTPEQARGSVSELLKHLESDEATVELSWRVWTEESQGS
jgi:hypothetical protein